MVFRVQYLVRDFFPAQESRQFLGGFDRRGSDQHRRPFLHAFLDIADHRLELLFLAEVYEVIEILADAGLVGRNHDHVETIDLAEFERLGIGGAGHSRELVVEPEVVLEGRGCERLALRLDVHALLGLDRLVQALREPPPLHGAPGVLVDQHHLAILDDVLHVTLEQVLGAQRRVDMMQQAEVHRVIEALALGQQFLADQHFLDQAVPLFGQLHLARLFVDGEMPFRYKVLVRVRWQLAAPQTRHQRVDPLVEARAVLGRARNDQRRACLVDQDRIDFVDYREIEGPLHLVFEAEDHVVAQVIETEFVVGAVGDVRGITVALALQVLVGKYHAHRHAEKAIDRLHPVRIAPCQVIIHRDHMHTGTRQCVQVDGQCRHQGLALAGPHLGNTPLVQRQATHELHIEMAHSERAPARLANGGKRFGQQLVERLARGNALAKTRRERTQCRVIHGLELRFEGVDASHYPAHALQLAVVLGTDDFAEELENHIACSIPAWRDESAWMCGIPDRGNTRQGASPRRRISAGTNYIPKYGGGSRLHQCSAELPKRRCGAHPPLRAVLMYCRGLTGRPSASTSKCR